MKKLFLFVAAFLFIATSANAEKLAGTLSSNLSHYTFDGNWELSNAADGDYTTKFWSNTDQAADDHITMTLSSEASVGEIKLFFADGDKPAAAAIEVSADNSDWQSVATFTEGDIASDNTYTCDALGASAQYVRLRFTAAKSAWFQLFEFEVYEAPVTDLTPRTITVSVADATMGTAYIGTEGTTSVADQTGAVQITAVPAAGYKFEKWTVGTEDVATTETYIDKTEGSKDYVANFVAKAIYEVSVSVNDATMGTADATAEGQVYEGTEITLIAQPAEGYEFVNWTVDENVLSSNATFTTTVNASVEYKANFKVKPNKLDLTSFSISMDPYSSNTEDRAVDGSYSTWFESNYNQEEGATATASFDGVKVVESMIITFGETYVPVRGKIQASQDGETWTDIEGAEFTSSDAATGGVITVDCKNTVAQHVRMVVVERRSTYFVIYEYEVYGKELSLSPRTVTVSVNDAAMGTAYIGEEGTTEVADATGVLNLVAVANEGYEFINWTVGTEVVSTEASYIDATEGNKDYVANFIALAKYEVSVSVNESSKGSAEATVTGEVDKYTEVTFTATPAEGCEFVNWTVDGNVVSKANPYTVSVEETAEYVANFRFTPVKLTPSAAETTMDESYYSASRVTDGSYSTYYYGTQAVDETITLTLPQETAIGDIKLHFSTPEYYMPGKAKVQVSSDKETWADIEGGAFTPESAEKNDETSTYQVYIDAKGVVGKYVRMIIEETAYSSIYMFEFEVFEYSLELAPRAIAVSVNDDTMGTAYIGEEGTTEVADATRIVTMVAVPNEGFEFVNWTLGTEVVSTDASIKDFTEGDKEYVANFVALAKYNVAVSVNDEAMGSATSTATGEVFKNTEVTFTATPAEGYEFVKWTVEREEVSKANPYTISVENSAEYVANFRLKPDKLALTHADISMAHYYTYTAANIIDGDYSTYYDSQGYQSNGATVTVTLAEESLIGDVKIYFNTNYRPGAAKIQVSTDGETWTDVENSEFNGSDAVQDASIGKYISVIDCGSTLAKYVRMTITTAASSYLQICEFEVYEAPVNVAPRTITVSVNDDTMGTAYIGTEGTTEVVDQTAAVKLTAVPNGIGYKFINWTVEGEEVATTPNFVDRTEGSKAYVANFVVKPQFEVSVSSASTSRGTVEATQTGLVYENEEVTFTATAVDGYKFINWVSGDEVVSEANPYTVAVTEAISLVANFERDPELNRDAWTVYDVSSEYAGLDGSQYVTGDKAIDGDLSTYWHTDWDDASNKTMPQWIVFDLGAVKSFDSFNYVSRASNQSANGNINEYKIYVSDEAPSKEALTSEMTEVHSGVFTYPGQEHKVTLTNAAKGRYVMLYATSSYGEGGTNMFANCAEFYLYSNSYTVAVSSSDPEIGTVYIGEEGVTTASCSVEGTDVVTITAVPVAGYRFVNWTLDGVEVSTDAEYTTTAVTESRDYVANFEFDPLEPRTVKVASNDKSKGYAVFVSPMPEGTATDVTTGEIVTVEAIAQSSDDFFVNWTINGEEVGTEPTYEYLGAEAVTIQANFISKYVVTIATSEGGVITVKQGEGVIATGDRVQEGEQITITVKENVRNELKELYVNDVNVFASYKATKSYTTTVTGATNIYAVYGDPVCYFTYEFTGNGWIEAWETDTYDAEADEAGTLELPVNPDGEQYAWGAVVPFDGTLAIFPIAGEGDELVSISVNGDDSMLEDVLYYGDYFVEVVEGPIHVIAEFTGTDTGIENAEATETSIYAVSGGITVEVAEATTVEVYTVAGTLVSEQIVSEKATIALQNGVYIVKAANEVVKVVVK